MIQNEGRALYINGEKIAGAWTLELDRAADNCERLANSIGTMSVALKLTGESWVTLHKLFAKIQRRVTLRYQLKRKGRPGWRYIR